MNPAQLITVGKRAAQWAQDLVLDLENIEIARNGLKLRGKEELGSNLTVPPPLIC